LRVDPPSQCWASHVNTILVQTLIAKIFSTKASTNTLELSRIVLSRKNLTSSQSSSDNVAKPSISKLEIPFRAHYRTKWRHFVFDRPFGRARADKMPICWISVTFAESSIRPESSDKFSTLCLAIFARWRKYLWMADDM